MNTLKPPVPRSGLFWAIAGLLLFLFVEIGGLWLWRSAAIKAEARRKNQRVEVERSSPPAPGLAATGEAAVRQQIEVARIRLNELQDGWAGRIERVGFASNPRLDFVVVLAEMRERLTAAADRSGVRVAPEAGSFGFAAFARQPPPPEARPAVERQRHAVELLVGALFEAQPRALLAVQRESTTPDANKSAGNAPSGPERSETFIPESERWMRNSVPVKSTGLRLSFCGETGTLRAFLNNITSREWPVVIRQVQVAPATPAETGLASSTRISVAPAPRRLFTSQSLATLGRGSETQGTISLRPVVDRQWSRFAVTVEWVEALTPMAGGDA